ncbi:MAG: hypothetical protein Q8P67_23950, partial [archaeon]|nr:hypothetical protein [archaeon]
MPREWAHLLSSFSVSLRTWPQGRPGCGGMEQRGQNWCPQVVQDSESASRAVTLSSAEQVGCGHHLVVGSSLTTASSAKCRYFS